MNTLTLKYEGDYLIIIQGQKIIASVKSDENAHVAIQRVFELLGLL